MSNARTKGRMLNRDISNSKKFAALSPKAAVLFCMIIPHLNSHGKLNGGAGFLKDEICPRLNYISLNDISKLMKEISDNTNMKWFEHEGRFWIHSINFLSQHQELKVDRLGQDLLPSYSGVNPDLVPPEVEVEEEDKGAALKEYFSFLFEKIWTRYPAKSGKEAAKKHFMSSITTVEAYADMCRALNNYLDMLEAEKEWRNPKDGQGWFNPKYWKDYIQWQPPIKQPVFNSMRGVR